MVNYRIVVKDGNDDPIGEFQTFRNLSLGKRLNNYGECSFEVPATDAKLSSLIALRVYSVYIYRDDVLLWAGEQVNRQGNLDDKGDNWCTITCFDWLEQLNHRFTVNEKIYEYQDGSQIAWDLIDTTQGETYGDLGITEGTLTETTFREKTYTNQNIMDAIINLANLDGGFDFEINNSKIFNIYDFIGIDRSDDIILEYGRNIKSMRITEDFSKPATRAIVLGHTGLAGDQIRIERDDLVAQASYKLRESVFSQLEQSETATFEGTGDALLRKNGNPLLKVTMEIVRSTTPTIADFALGDILRLIVKRGIYNIDEQFRVFEWKVKYNTDNTETLSLTVSNFYNEV